MDRSSKWIKRLFINESIFEDEELSGCSSQNYWKISPEKNSCLGLSSQHLTKKSSTLKLSTNCKLKENNQIIFSKCFSRQRIFLILCMFQVPKPKTLCTTRVSNLQFARIKQLNFFRTFFSQNIFWNFLNVPNALSKKY